MKASAHAYMIAAKAEVLSVQGCLDNVLMSLQDPTVVGFPFWEVMPDSQGCSRDNQIVILTA